MKNAKNKAGFICAGLLVTAAAAGAAGLNGDETTYSNMIRHDTYMQQMADNRTSDALYRNTISLESFTRQLADQRVGDALYRNVMTYEAFAEQLNDDYTPPYRNVFSVERFYALIGDPCLEDGMTEGPVQFAKCEVR